MNCKICTSTMTLLRNARILDKYDIEYFKCDRCGFIQTETPYWLSEAYLSPINASDTGIVARNIHLAKVTASVIYFLFNKDSSFLDYAGGYGLLTRIMRDIGFDFFWHDPHTTNLFARGFEYSRSNPIELITSFESFEHFVNPLKDIESMLEISANILLTTEMIPETESKDWWYYGFEHGQHVSFYSKRTLVTMAEKYSLNLYSNERNCHLLTKKVVKPGVFQLLNRFSGPAHVLIRRIMSSKTVLDHELAKARMQ